MKDGQLSIYDMFGIPEEVADKKNYIVESFSAGNFCSQEARQALEAKYEPILEVSLAGEPLAAPVLIDLETVAYWVYFLTHLLFLLFFFLVCL